MWSQVLPAVAALAAIALPRAVGAEAKVARAVRLQSPPVIDGDVIEDPAWRAAPVASGFSQTNPDDGRPASEETEIRVGFTDDTLYIGIVCHDPAPEEILLSEARRDSSLNDTDSVLVVLDTFHDRQNGFVFGTTPAGQEYDGQVTNNGGGGGFSFGRQFGGSLSGFNLNWDGSWQVKARVGGFGWSAELAIPFRTLRFAGGGRQTWGINFQRSIRRRSETAFWSPLARQFNLHRVSAAGALEGLELPRQRNLQLVPYALGQLDRDWVARGPSNVGGNAGADVKYGVTSSLTLDLTVRTDFAQVEVDEQQINLDRFSLFFPEKRPFFLENAGSFTAGHPGEVDLFFSRRIGIGPGGEAVPIVGGARLSGKVGRLRVGLLDLQTETLWGTNQAGERERIAPANNFGVARFGWELPNRSGVGVLFTSRQATVGGPAGEPWQDDFGRTYAADGRWGIGRYLLLSGFVAGTETGPPGAVAEPPVGHHLAWHAGGRYDAPAWLLSASFTEIGGAFDPQVGFLRRQGYRKLEGLTMHRWRPESLLGIKELRPHVWSYVYLKPDGFQETRFIHLDNHTEWRNGFVVHTGVNFTREGVLDSFDIDPSPDSRVLVEPGSYDHAEAMLLLETSAALPVALDTSLIAGGFFGGTRVSPRGTLRVRAGDRLGAEARWEHNRIRLPAGSFVANLVAARVSYSFTPRMFVQGLAQFSDSFHAWSSNLRFGWLRDANTGLFVVYNENLDTRPGWRGWTANNRSVVIKVSWLFDVFQNR